VSALATVSGADSGTTTVVPPAGPSRGQPSTPRREDPFRVLSTVLIVGSLLSVWALVYLTVLSPFEEGHAQQGLYQRLRTELALGTAPIAAPIASGAPVAMLDVPAAGLHHVVVVEGTGARQLQSGPGHLTGSVLPGQEGVSVLLGRALSFGAPFGRIPDLRAGDTMVVRTGEGQFTYRVTDVRRRGDPVPLAPAAGQSRLTLVTAKGSGALGAVAPSDTVYVDASLSGRKAVAAGAVGEIDPAGAPMHADAGRLTLLELVLALQLLLIVLVALAWARGRWRALPTWIAGVPAALAALWVTSSVASLLLPNLV